MGGGETSGVEERKFCMKKMPPHTKIRFYLFFLCLLKNWRQNARLGVNFANILRTHRFKKRKKYSQAVSLFLCFWDL